MSDGEAAIEAAALRLLARREYARAELRSRLVRQSGFAAEAVDAVLTSLEGRGYLSDARYREARMRSRAARGQGPVRVAQDWRASGAGDDRVLLAEVDWLARARQVLQKRFGEQAPGDAKEWARRARFLQGRGFPPDLIRKALAGEDFFADGE
ncbi:regulatory protein RecX [Acidithiobacillus sp. CV18-2]|uniref:Regulatory protein RecX n=1 Tax=Igneacidithiobacillus copahuensis TaxID=2724909 RepID=A0AAE3CIY4_9PROT|nr:regulatory protein RecX [Igneacidithiobacillus copahuensis]MBU2754285.1 regulatory protein RecX [Acidithiobacillus sp. CV18-3]MBU2757692.1 regulatory protein RecX [Acidithiobacillus sp. BN09-2]MBU2776993.1 regulatory protein RecX [Acidithiobacillus sp. CV18-2]MBU2797297.1 regulatory protein RecX [Acidithiobacillus sp. VAN18-2]MBU2799856.1 regulatory protein RecX [Acidithiobacillus sp. VAN18-4]UTV82021.1 RecX family transcriptional regulator [Acidithiobacillus sp. YTS05]